MERLILPADIRPRKPISASEKPFLEKVCAIIKEHEEYWPLSLRTVHYRLLSYDVVRNARSGARYVNDWASYHALGDLLLRARISGIVDWEAIEDSTRPVTLERGWAAPSEFVHYEKRVFLTGYQRQLM
jgi:hypothetical protein